MSSTFHEEDRSEEPVLEDPSPREEDRERQGMAVAAQPVRVTQARVDAAVRRSWQAFSQRPVEHVLTYLLFTTASVLLPFLGFVFRTEALLGVLGRMARGREAAFGEVILPVKARESYDIGFWRLLWNVARTDATVGLLFVVVAIFAAIPAAVLYPINATLSLSAAFVSADLITVSWLPMAFVGIVTLGALWIAMMTYARLLSRVPATQINSALHLFLITRALGAMRRHLAFVFKASLIPAGLAIGLGVIGGGLFALTQWALPTTHLFLMTALMVPAVLVMVAYVGALSFQVSETLAATVDEAEIALYEGISLSERFVGFLGRIWRGLLSASQINYLVMASFVATTVLLLAALVRGLDSLSNTYLGVFAVVVASFTALAALNARKGGEQS